MAIVANGARLQWHAYEFGVRKEDGHVTKVRDLEEAVELARTTGGRSMFRATYQTDWMEATAG